MKGFAGYGAVCLAIIAGLVLALWPFLGPGGRRGILVAAAVAVPFEMGALGLLRAFRDRPNGFLAAVAGGFLGRMVAVGAVALALTRSGDRSRAEVGVLALVGFLFVLMLLEPVFIRDRPLPDGSGDN
ncbi:MAG TPA: hypothetical protein VE173_06505 [Longimicrobiales bacterium]|nr:hypothetical protein [Longimicrobiales bacterium]